jgi:hypothetical protein
MTISADILRELLEYDAESGEFRWLLPHTNQMKVGDVAGAVCTSGHIQIKLFGRSYMAHRLAWLYMTGEWPEALIDHKNRLPADNRWDNLRPATLAENARNKEHGKGKAGHRGVYWNKNNSKWQASIRIAGRNHSLGYFKELSDAISARLAGEAHHFGEFAVCAIAGTAEGQQLPGVVPA